MKVEDNVQNTLSALVGATSQAGPFTPVVSELQLITMNEIDVKYCVQGAAVFVYGRALVQTVSPNPMPYSFDITLPVPKTADPDGLDFWGTVSGYCSNTTGELVSGLVVRAGAETRATIGIETNDAAEGGDRQLAVAFNFMYLTDTGDELTPIRPLPL
jgi:hypothetical protein